MSARKAGRGGDTFELSGSGGRFEARGTLTFATASAAWKRGLALLKSDPSPVLQIDGAGITAADSAGLVVLLDWLVAARRAGRRLTYQHLPASVVSLAAISDLDDLLKQGFPK